MADPAPHSPPPALEDFVVQPVRRPGGLPRRCLTIGRHLMGLVYGRLLASVRDRPERAKSGLAYRLEWLLAILLRPLFAASKLIPLPFPVQLRRRLEMLGPTYIKLGQVLSLRSDILPRPVTDELKNLLDRLPVVPFEAFLERVRNDLGKPVERVFDWIDPEPLGSASIAQTHRGTLKNGQAVILKVVKPGIRETLERDSKLLWLLARILQGFFPRYQPKRMIDEFVAYTRREVDLRLEADNAEIFAANFADLPDIVFPAIYRHASGANLLTMEYLSGERPDSLRARNLAEGERRRLIERGASAIIRMIYRDGFFHADLHPGNLLVLPGPKLGFIDLGMVGRFDDELRRTLLYYFYCLVMGDAENAARYLASTAKAGVGARPAAFRREVAEICRRWHRSAKFADFSLGQLILESVERGARHRLFFPVEMVLMTKALVTFEGVGHILEPEFDVVAVSQQPIQALLLQQLNPLRLVEAGLRSAPEIFDAMIKTPALVSEAMRLLEAQNRQPPENPIGGLHGALFGGFCLLSGVVLWVSDGPLWAALALAGLGFLVGLFARR
ncbi:MAG: AarF/UbiB family protein [Acidobacteriota bacterium]